MEQVKQKLLFLKALESVIADAETSMQIETPTPKILQRNTVELAEATVNLSQRWEELSIWLQTKLEGAECSVQYNTLTEALKTMSANELGSILATRKVTGGESMGTLETICSRMAFLEKDCSELEDELNELSYKCAELNEQLEQIAVEPEEHTSPEIEKLKAVIEKRKARIRIIQGILGKLLWGGHFDAMKDPQIAQYLLDCDHHDM